MANTNTTTDNFWKTHVENPWGRAVDNLFGGYPLDQKNRPMSLRGVTAHAAKGIVNPLGLAFSVGLGGYFGYQEGGTWGAVKGVAQGVALDFAFSWGIRAAGLHPLIGLAAAAGGASYAALSVGEQYNKQRGNLNMNTPQIDSFGLMSTMRQRSLQQMQMSHLNMRSALGNEAQFLHR